MAEAAKKMPIRMSRADSRAGTHGLSHPVEQFWTEIDRLLSDFLRGYWHIPFRRSAVDVEPIWRGEISLGATPVVDIVDKDDAYKLTAELPGVDEKQVEIGFSNGTLTIEGKRTRRPRTPSRIISYRSATTAVSIAHSVCRMGSIRTRSRPPSGTVCSALRCRKQPSHAGSRRRSRSRARERIAGAQQSRLNPKLWCEGARQDDKGQIHRTTPARQCAGRALHPSAPIGARVPRSGADGGRTRPTLVGDPGHQPQPMASARCRPQALSIRWNSMLLAARWAA